MINTTFPARKILEFFDGLRGMGNMSEIFDHYTDTAGNEHWTDTETGHRVSRKIQTVGSEDRNYITPKMTGWICPVCGRGLSPFTAVCPCKNDNKWQVTCEWQERWEG